MYPGTKQTKQIQWMIKLLTMKDPLRPFMAPLAGRSATLIIETAPAPPAQACCRTTARRMILCYLGGRDPSRCLDLARGATPRSHYRVLLISTYTSKAHSWRNPCGLCSNRRWSDCDIISGHDPTLSGGVEIVLSLLSHSWLLKASHHPSSIQSQTIKPTHPYRNLRQSRECLPKLVSMALAVSVELSSATPSCKPTLKWWL